MHRRAMLATLVLVPLLAVSAPASAEPSAAQVVSAYSLAAPRAESASGLVARAVVPAGARCPSLRVVRALDGRIREVAMSVRPAPARTAPAFEAITVCTAPMPAGSSAASIAGVRVPSHMPDRVDRLALLGDSGCRIATWQVQDCASPDAWPLARVAQSVAREHPDALLFNGDFFYREAACPASAQALCGSSPPPLAAMPFTDSAYGWVADVLMPMAPMLAAAPLVVTRGNHEACYRGGNGFFLLFDPRTGTQDTCAPTQTATGLVAAETVPTSTYVIDLTVRAGRVLRLAIVDSAGGNDSQVTAFSGVQRPAYEAAARQTAPVRGRESWLVTHRPVYAYVSSTFAQPGSSFNPWGSADQTAASYGLLGGYELVFSSHEHLAQAVQLPGYPGQLVLGNAATLLDPPTGYPLPASGPPAGPGLAYPAPSSAWVATRFGYAIATPNAESGSWRIRMKDPSGAAFARCGVRSRQISCADSPS